MPAADRTRTPAGAYELLERLRWDAASPPCPHCGVAGRSYLLRTASATGRRVWKCGACRRQFSVLVGTVLQGTRLDLWTWIAVLSDWVATGPLRPGEVADRYHLSPEAARTVVRRVQRSAEAARRA